MTTFQSQQCPLPQLQNNRVLASFPTVLTQGSPAIFAKFQGIPKTNAENSKKEKFKRKDYQSTKKDYPKCPICDKTNHPAWRCWKGAGAQLKSKILKVEDTDTNDTSTTHCEPAAKQTTSILKNKKKLDLPRRQDSK